MVQSRHLVLISKVLVITDPAIHCMESAAALL